MTLGYAFSTQLRGVRQRLGASRFDQAYSAGSGLTQQQAVANVRDQHGTGTQTP